MINLLHAEFYKISKSTALKICFLLSCISAVALVIISHNIAIGTLSTDIAGSASGLTEIVIVSLLGSLMAGIIICNDFETKTIHDAVACGGGRMSIVICKAIVYVFGMIMLLLPYMLATLIGFLSGSEFATSFVASVFVGILGDKAGDAVTAGAIAKIITISFVTMIVSAARLSVCIPLAFKIRKPVAILSIGFVFNALIDLVINLGKDISGFTKLISFTPYYRDNFFITVNTKNETLLKAVICSIIFIGIMSVITYLSFKRDDIK